MDSIEKIATLFPELKHQLMFWKEREKLFQVFNDNSVSSIDSSPAIPINSSLPDSPLRSMNNLSTNDCMIDQMLGKATIKQETNLIFPDEYTIPVLPKALVQDIETCLLHKFGPHHTNRQILIDTITHDLIEKYNLL
ncbi:unnamed protein product [Didymodactylos carnosus]|uniref:Uncharacterized protein n=1 Tax=Didymodactylos carnosus TaxID=1234261 RepID=A0A814E3T8_9BILA|nr:unnamed protein product [Didymodactylos carnosus]CAF3739284.1 unnamed protein product [Didymodactylos carnosus]